MVTVKFRHGTRFIPDFWYGRGSGWAKPFKSTVRARISYEPGATSSRRAVQGIMLKSTGQSLGRPVMGSKPQISFDEVPLGRIVAQPSGGLIKS